MKKIKGITLFTNNVTKMVEFYKTLLETEPTEQSDMSALFILENFTIFIHKHHEASPDLPPSEDHLEIITENIVDESKRITTQGVAIDYPVKKILLGNLYIS